MDEVKSGETICQVCGEAVGDDVIACPACETPHHKDCWEFNKGCSTYACKPKPPTTLLPPSTPQPSIAPAQISEGPRYRRPPGRPTYQGVVAFFVSLAAIGYMVFAISQDSNSPRLDPNSTISWTPNKVAQEMKIRFFDPIEVGQPLSEARKILGPRHKHLPRTEAAKTGRKGRLVVGWGVSSNDSMETWVYFIDNKVTQVKLVLYKGGPIQPLHSK